MAGKSAKAESGATIGYEAQLWKAADVLPGNMDAAEHADVARLNAETAENLRRLGYGE